MVRRNTRDFERLSIVVDGDEPPTEFRVFTAGKVETSKGSFLFDEKAAKSVLVHYADQGNELMVDYDHASLDLAIDPAQAGKAAGWFNLEVREGALWAVNVRWTEPASAALKRREWRYMSPAFSTDEDGRILELINVALTNIPATKKLQPLMAASALAALGGSMDPAKVKDALEAIKNGDANKALELLEAMIAEAAGGETPPEGEPPPDAMADDEEPPEQMAEGEEEDAPAAMAAASRLFRLTAKTTLAEALDEVETWRQSHINLGKREAQLAKDRAAIEASDRRRLLGELVTKAGKAPATVWADEKAKKAKPYLERMSLAELTAYVADEIAAVPAGSRRAPTPPTGGGTTPEGGQEFDTPDGKIILSAKALAECKTQKLDPQKVADTRAAIRARSTHARTEA